MSETGGGEEHLTLRDLFNEIKQQRLEVQTLREEVKGSSENVASEVKKIKTVSDLKWKFQGNKIQFDFNSNIVDVVNQISWSVQNGKLDYSVELCNDILQLVKKRNKLIRIADTSAGGWETVRNYETNPVASDSDDESRIQKAENRALKRKRFSSRGRAASTSTATSSGSVSGYMPSTPWGSGASFRPAIQQGVGRGRLFRGPTSYSNYGLQPGAGLLQGAPGPCFACGDFSHFRKDCPRVARFATGSGVQQGIGGK